MTPIVYRWTVLANVLITTCMAVLSASGTFVANSAIRGELALSNQEAVWLTTLYLLGINSVVPTAAWFADHFGYKKIYAIGVLIFSLGSGFASLSTNFWMIASARLIEGIGGGFIFPIGLAKITQNFPKNILPLALILYVTASFGGGVAFGLVISGYLTQFYTWRLIFGLLCPLAIIAFFFCWYLHKETPIQDRSRFDFWGYFFFVTFITALLLALTYGPLASTDEGWRSPFVLSCFAIAAICFLATITFETRHEHPILPLALFKDPMFAVSSIAMFLLGMSIFSSISTTVDYMLEALFYERFTSGKIAMIYGLSMAASSILTTPLLKKIPAPILTFLGLSLLIASYFLNNILDLQTGPRQISLILFLRGIGVGLSLGPTTILALHKIPTALQNKAATLLTFFRQVGGTYGGALIAILVIKRKIFHATRFSEQTNSQIPGYRVTFQKLFGHFYNQVSDKGLLSANQAKLVIAKDVELQATVAAQNDAFFVFGCVTAIIALLLVALMIDRWWKARSALEH